MLDRDRNHFKQSLYNHRLASQTTQQPNSTMGSRGVAAAFAGRISLAASAASAERQLATSAGEQRRSQSVTQLPLCVFGLRGAESDRRTKNPAPQNMVCQQQPRARRSSCPTARRSRSRPETSACTCPPSGRRTRAAGSPGRAATTCGATARGRQSGRSPRSSTRSRASSPSPSSRTGRR